MNERTFWETGCVFLVAIAIGITASPLEAQTYAVTTFAGAPAFGYQDATGDNARLGYLAGIATDSSGTVYFPDPYAHTIRKMTPAGAVTTLAGSPGVSGFVDGIGSTARFSLPWDVKVDPAGNVFVADSGNNAIRKITPDGEVTTLAGNGTSGTADGAGSSARFRQPIGLALDSTGNVFVVDRPSGTIRKVTPAGVVLTIAGTSGIPGSADSVGTAAQFLFPGGIAIDSANVIYVTDSGNATIRKIATNLSVTTLAGSAGDTGTADGVGNAARFEDPTGIAVDSAGNIYVTDWGSNTVRKVTPAGVVSTVSGVANTFGSFDGAAVNSAGAVSTVSGVANSFGSSDGAPVNSLYHHPNGIAVDPSGDIYITDSRNATIRRIHLGGVITVAGRSALGTTGGLRGDARFTGPSGLGFDAAGNCFVADYYNQEIRKITPGGTVSTFAGSLRTSGSIDGSGVFARFAYPNDLVVDSSGTIYITDSDNGTIRQATADGVVTTLAGTAGAFGNTDGTGSAARFDTPWGIAMDSSGNLFVSDLAQHTIRKITAQGVVTTLAGTAGVAGSLNGQGTAARFNAPRGLSIDGSGNLYVADSGNDVIRKITPTGTVTTWAGFAGIPGSTDGVGAAARFSFPVAVLANSDGTLFVADSDNSCIRKIDPNRTVTTVAGSGSRYGDDDGLGTDASLASPAGLARDASGAIYFTDFDALVVRKLGEAGTSVTPTSFISNLSVRANLLAGQTIIAGLVTNGSKPVVIRGIGPGLAKIIPSFTLAGDPRLQMYFGPDLEDSNDNWGGTDFLTSEFSRLGAFFFPAASLDAALARTMAGPHTIWMTPTTSGIGLFEAYDGSAGSAVRLVNVAARYQASSGDGTLIAGFVIVGSGQKTLLIRGVGPSLSLVGVPSGMMTDPKVEVFSADGKIADSDDWRTSLASTASLIGGFPMTTGSKDAAVLVSVPPGIYTAQVSGVNGSAGDALVEVYEVGN